jgi:endonuclease-3
MKAKKQVEKFAQQKSRATKVVRLLQKYYPGETCALVHDSPLQLLIATILSAQCTDERVNQVTPALFRKFPTAFALANAPLLEIEQLIRPTGFYKNKSKNIKACCESLVALYKGEVPQTLEQLVELQGVGRKTANVVLGVSFGIASGIVVDTHVTRLSNRLAFTKGENAIKIEQDLIPLIAKNDWIEFSHLLITHGRRVCKARTPQCEVCFLDDLCPKIGVSKA